MRPWPWFSMFAGVLICSFGALGAHAAEKGDAISGNSATVLTAADSTAGSEANKAARAESNLFSLPPLEGSENHPLMPALRRAYASVESLRAIRDYTCTLIKRERVNGELLPAEYMDVKLRHEPFSVHIYFRSPTEKRGREAIFEPSQNRGRIVGYVPNIGTVTLDPNSRRAMEDNRYPISEVGVLNLTRRLVEVGLSELNYGECKVTMFENAKINERPATCMQFEHPTPRREFRYHLARVYIDNELNVPLRYEAYTWPSEPGGKPVLVEEYTYLNMKLNVGLTDRDFSPANPEYSFDLRSEVVE